MKVITHRISDQLNKHNHIHAIYPENFPRAKELGRDSCLEWIKAHQEWRGGERYEYEGYKVEEIYFLWEMTADDLRKLRYERSCQEDNYCGSLYFGKYKMEFIWDEEIQNYINCFEYNPKDGGSGYGFINGIPYDECLRIQEEFRLPSRRSLEEFTKSSELQLLSILNANWDLIPSALKEMSPAVWYADRTYNPTINIIH